MLKKLHIVLVILQVCISTAIMVRFLNDYMEVSDSGMLMVASVLISVLMAIVVIIIKRNKDGGSRGINYYRVRKTNILNIASGTVGTILCSVIDSYEVAYAYFSAFAERISAYEFNRMVYELGDNLEVLRVFFLQQSICTLIISVIDLIVAVAIINSSEYAEYDDEYYEVYGGRDEDPDDEYDTGYGSGYGNKYDSGYKKGAPVKFKSTFGEHRHTPEYSSDVVTFVPVVVCPICGYKQPKGTAVCMRCESYLNNAEELECLFDESKEKVKRFCDKCGSSIEEGVSFCGYCGNKIE